MATPKLSYKVIAKDILSAMMSLDPETFDFTVAIKDNYPEALNAAMKAYNDYVIEKFNETVANSINIRSILVNVFREIDATSYDEAHEILTSTLKVQFEKVKRSERYKRDIARNKGKEYESELVNFKNVDETKEKTDIIIESDSFDIYAMLNNKKAEEFGKEEKEIVQPIVPKSISKFVINYDDDENNTINTAPEPIISKPISTVIDKFIFPFKTENMLGSDFNLSKLDYKLYKIKIRGTNKYEQILPFVQSTISNVTYTSKYTDVDTGEELDVKKYNWDISIMVASNDSHTEIIDKLKLFPMLSNAQFNIIRLNRALNNYVTIIL